MEKRNSRGSQVPPGVTHPPPSVLEVAAGKVGSRFFGKGARARDLFADPTEIPELGSRFAPVFQSHDPANPTE